MSKASMTSADTLQAESGADICSKRGLNVFTIMDSDHKERATFTITSPDGFVQLSPQQAMDLSIQLLQWVKRQQGTDYTARRHEGGADA